MLDERRFGEDEAVVVVQFDGGRERVLRRRGAHLVQVLREAELADHRQTRRLELAFGLLLGEFRSQSYGQCVSRDTDPAVGPADDLAGGLRAGNHPARGEHFARPLVRPDEHPARARESNGGLVVDPGLAYLPEGAAAQFRRSLGGGARADFRAHLDRDDVVEFFSLDEMTTLIVLT